MERIANHLTTAQLDLADARSENDAYYSGETDAYSIDYHLTRIEELKNQLQSLDPKTDAFTHVIVSSFLVASYFRLNALEQPVDVGWLVETTKRNVDIAPSSTTRHDYNVALLIRATERLRAQNKELDQLIRDFRRGFNHQTLLAIAMERSQTVRELARHDADVKTYAAYLQRSYDNYPSSRDIADWAFMRNLDSKAGEQFKQATANSRKEAMEIKVNNFLNPPSPTSTYTKYWLRQIVGETQAALAILHEAKSSGIKVPVPN